jgi:hypothetical protein
VCDLDEGFRLVTHPHNESLSLRAKIGPEDIIEVTGVGECRIPQKVKTRPDLFIGGDVNTCYHPAYEGAPILTSVSNGMSTFFFVDGIKLSRNSSVGEITRKKASSIFSECGFLTNEPYLDFQNLRIRTRSELMYRMIQIDHMGGSLTRFYQSDIGQYSGITSLISMAYVIARSLLLTMDATGVDIYPYNEDDFAMVILTLLMHHD